MGCIWWIQPYTAVFPNWGAMACHLQYSGVPWSNMIFNTSLKNTFSKCLQTLKQIAMSSPLDAANYISFLYGTASWKRLGNTTIQSLNPLQNKSWSSRNQCIVFKLCSVLSYIFFFYLFPKLLYSNMVAVCIKNEMDGQINTFRLQLRITSPHQLWCACNVIITPPDQFWCACDVSNTFEHKATAFTAYVDHEVNSTCPIGDVQKSDCHLINLFYIGTDLIKLYCDHQR